MPQRYHVHVLDKPFDISEDVEAIQLTKESASRALLFCGGVEVEEIDSLDATKRFVGINVATPEGPKRASEGWWITKNSNGQFDVLSDANFQSKYVLVQPGEE